MAGHSKFKNIMHRKGAQDAKRAKIFAKFAREITVAARNGGDPDMNPRLRGAIAAGRAKNMPNDRIKKAIQKAVGGGDEANYEEVRYEGYGPGGIALIIETLTDNRNRTASEVRSSLTKHGGNLGETGSVGFMFEQVGLLAYPIDTASVDDMFEAALEAGASDVDSEGENHEINCAVEDFSTVRDALEKKYGTAIEGRLDWKPQTLTDLEESTASTLLKLLDVLEDNDDVQRVASNADISEEILERLQA